VGDAGLSKVLSQAIAIVCATPLSFVGQKLWSFRA
jgi:putative flippase GtrA